MYKLFLFIMYELFLYIMYKLFYLSCTNCFYLSCTNCFYLSCNLRPGATVWLIKAAVRRRPLRCIAPCVRAFIHRALCWHLLPLCSRTHRAYLLKPTTARRGVTNWERDLAKHGVIVRQVKQGLYEASQKIKRMRDNPQNGVPMRKSSDTAPQSLRIILPFDSRHLLPMLFLICLVTYV